MKAKMIVVFDIVVLEFDYGWPNYKVIMTLIKE